jgi:NADH:ubiquinone oxidoreductase subunit F (NADH-binding)
MTTVLTSTYAGTADRLLHGTDTSYRAHVNTHGPLPRVRRRDAGLLAAITASGLTGRGGAGFPTATKLTAVADKRRTSVIANGTDSEPASEKDAVLMTDNPHLVLDGLAIAASLVGARNATIAVAEDGPAATALARAIAERPQRDRPRLALVSHRFVSGEESALVSAVRGGAGLPTGRRPFADGILVQNVETLAHLALIARYGAVWFRAAGTDAEPGTALATVSGAVADPGVVEFELGTTIGELFDQCGGLIEPVDYVLVGGYFGRWLRLDTDLKLTNEALGAHSASLGARVIVALPRSACGLAEVSRVVRYMAGESAGQCGPCVFGLPALADALDALIEGRHTNEAQQRLALLRTQIARRGACHHPDGTLAFVASALDVFAGEIEQHRHGQCSATLRAPVLPILDMRDDRR